MKTLNYITGLVLLALAFGTVAHADPNTNALTVQAYMKRNNGTAVSDGAYSLAFGVFQNNVALWAQSYTVTITNGLFKQDLSGSGGNMGGLPAGTGMNANFTGATLGSALLMGAADGTLKVRVYAVSPINTANPQFDITMNSVPTALVADIAKSVDAGVVGISNMTSAAMVTISAGAGDAAKLVQTDSTGLIDASLIPNLDGSIINAGTVAVLNGGTGATTAAGARTNLGAAQSGDNSDITSLSGLTLVGGNMSFSGTATNFNGAVTMTGNNAHAGTEMFTGMVTMSAPVVVSSSALMSGVVTMSGNNILSGNNTFSGTQMMTGQVTITAASILSKLSLGAATNTNIGGATTYNDGNPLVYTTALHTLTMTANVAVTLSCIESTAAVPGSVLIVVQNPTLVAHTANTFTVTHNTACTTGNNKRIYTNTVGTLTGATNNSPAYVVLVYDGTRWLAVAALM